MGASVGRAPAAALVVVLAVTGLAVAVLFLPERPGLDQALVANLSALVSSATAAGCGIWRAVHSAGRRRRAWSALGAALTCWAVGDAIWAWLDATGRDPFPSVADVAYLAFGPLACAGVLLLFDRGGRVHRLQDLLDGMATSGALVLVSWATALGAAVRAAEASQPLASAVSVAYPVLDVLIAVLAVLALARAPAGRPRLPLTLLVAGLVLNSVADSGFVYLTATEGYEPGTALDVVWSLGLGCLALAALLDRHRGDVRPAAVGVREAIVPSGGLLPYVPIGIALAVVIVTEFIGGQPSPAEEVGVLALVLLLLLRQYLTLRENALLAARLAAREEELHHQAFHDALTGLANQALFRERLEHALELHARDRRPLAVVYLDLDDFKLVNDTLGHAAGDELLVRVSERINAAVRTGDTVARLGGDEFAVLLGTADGAGPAGEHCAERIAEALRTPIDVAGRPVRARVSAGTVQLGPQDPAMSADQVLTSADQAMYARKPRMRGA
ncbi:GGDEF domain-containing protein [Pseudonocardia humida]|uniref:GGDEF domain-containing protein n=1 Tax=Pseudonocardia humida TaxID=2800819 RepID=A0ABT1A044_9PSEU|nr:GGDEF domain-containing protein [Pseudonocardia humida]MCO1656367.1 GGDEF domain-containing protein [Pseudonocardia humida]